MTNFNVILLCAHSTWMPEKYNYELKPVIYPLFRECVYILRQKIQRQLNKSTSYMIRFKVHFVSGSNTCAYLSQGRRYLLSAPLTQLHRSEQDGISVGN